MYELNRSLIVLFCGVLIMLAAVVIFLTWSANTEVIDGLFDAVGYLEDHNDDPGRLIVTLGAMIIAVAALLVIILELAPEDEIRELKVRQAGATTIVPAQALRDRLEEALVALPDVTAARVKVNTRDEGIAASLDITVTPTANVAHVTQESARVVIDTIQEDLGLPLRGTPVVRVAFGGEKPAPVASSVSQPPQPAEPSPPPQTPEPPQADAPQQPPEPQDYTQFQRPAERSQSPYAPPETQREEQSPPEGGDQEDRPQT